MSEGAFPKFTAMSFLESVIAYLHMLLAGRKRVTYGAINPWLTM